MHQLKENDAVYCETKEQWAEILKLAALNEIPLYIAPLFEEHKLFVTVESRLENDKKILVLHTVWDHNPDSINFYKNLSKTTFEIFCDKLKGRFQDGKKYSECCNVELQIIVYPHLDSKTDILRGISHQGEPFCSKCYKVINNA